MWIFFVVLLSTNALWGMYQDVLLNHGGTSAKHHFKIDEYAIQLSGSAVSYLEKNIKNFEEIMEQNKSFFNDKNDAEIALPVMGNRQQEGCLLFEKKGTSLDVHYLKDVSELKVPMIEGWHFKKSTWDKSNGQQSSVLSLIPSVTATGQNKFVSNASKKAENLAIVKFGQNKENKAAKKPQVFRKDQSFGFFKIFSKNFKGDKNIGIRIKAEIEFKLTPAAEKFGIQDLIKNEIYNKYKGRVLPKMKEGIYYYIPLQTENDARLNFASKDVEPAVMKPHFVLDKKDRCVKIDFVNNSDIIYALPHLKHAFIDYNAVLNKNLFSINKQQSL